MPTIYNKVTLDGVTLIDISDTTAVAADVSAGKYFYNAAGVKTPGANSGSGSYSRAIIVPQQTVTPNSNRVAVLNALSTIEDAKDYIVTLDGVEWFTTAETLWTSNYIIGDPNWFTGTPANYVYPFGVGSEGNTTEVAFQNTNQHTIKIERIELLDDGIVDGNNLSYGLIDGTLPLAGVGKVDSAEI